MTSPDAALRTYLQTVAAVTDLVGDQIRPHVSAADDTGKRIIYQMTDRSRRHHSSGVSSVAFATIVYDIFAASDEEVEEVGDALRAALDGQSGTFGGVLFRFVRLRNEEKDMGALTGGELTGPYRLTQTYGVAYWEE